jgi:transposase
MRTGAPWRDLPGVFGPWQSVYTAFRRWLRSGLWSSLLTQLSAQQSDDKYLMIDTTSSRVHQHGAGPVRGQLAHAMGRSRASLSTKIHLAFDALGYPLGFILTGANVSDFDQCKPLLIPSAHDFWTFVGPPLVGLPRLATSASPTVKVSTAVGITSHLKPNSFALMDKAYESDAIRAHVNQLGGGAVINVISSRSQKSAFDEHRYRERHRIENLFARLKVFRHIATRYEKLRSTYAAMVTLACVLIWLKY